MKVVKPNGDIIHLTVDEYKQLYRVKPETTKINSTSPTTSTPYISPTIENPWKTTFTC